MKWEVHIEKVRDNEKVIWFAPVNAIIMTLGYEELEEVEVLEDLGLEDEKSLIVFNDDHNTFDHVISTLIKVCKHDQHQAEQCTYIIHFKGKCSVKKGTLPMLKPMREGIVDAGINAEIH